MPLVVLDSISLSTPDGRPLFDSLTLALGRERTGLVGRNGCGKSTLLRLISGETEPANGTVHRSGSIGVLAQHLDEQLNVAQALGVADAMARLRRLERGEGSLDDAGHADWTLEDRITSTFAGTGLPSLPLHRPIASLSGGERTRVALARLLIEAPDLLLLDEPTNNLDADGRSAVADLLAQWQGGAIVASHDRELLEHVDRIVELTPVGVTVFGGAWSEFAEARELHERAPTPTSNALPTHSQCRAQRYRRRRRERPAATRPAAPTVPAAVRRRYCLGGQKQRAENSGARESRIAERQIEKRSEALTEARARVEILTPLTIELPETGLPRSRQLVAFKDVVMAHGERRLFGPLSFDMSGPRTHRRPRRQRLRQDHAAAADLRRPRTRRGRNPPRDGPPRRARPACRPARPGRRHPRQHAS